MGFFPKAMENQLCFACTEQRYAKPTTRVRCSVCKKEVSWRHVVSHYAEHGKKSGNDVVCPICNAKVKSQEYRRHVRMHFAVKSEPGYMCGICGRGFVTLRSLLVHLLKTHE
jgi:DNA-directed RNA polymerase subunit RPC12/RpoP